MTGSGQASVTYTVGPGYNGQQNAVTLPWRLTVPDAQWTNSPILLAQLQGSGAIGCTITRSGQVVATAQSSGQYVIAQRAPKH